MKRKFCNMKRRAKKQGSEDVVQAHHTQLIPETVKKIEPILGEVEIIAQPNYPKPPIPGDTTEKKELETKKLNEIE